MTEIELIESTLIVHVRGTDNFWSFKSQLEIPLIHVVGAEVDPAVGEHWDDLVEDSRFPGTHVPGVSAAGGYYISGGWVFWNVQDPQKALTINLAHEHYTKLVIEVRDPAADVARIEEAVRAHKSS
jgi:hypothetical protein